MHASVTKRDLGRGYIVAAGVVLSVVLLAHVVGTLQANPLSALIAAAGLVPAVALAGSTYWLSESGLSGDQIWRVAQWSGFGIALLTLVNLGVLSAAGAASGILPALLAIGVALGAMTGLLVGALLEFRRVTERLERGNAVLGRVIQHNLRNDLTVLLGHLGELEREIDGTDACTDRASERIDRLSAKIDDIVSTAEKAHQIDVALDVRRRPTEQVDVVPLLTERLDAVERCHPDAVIETDVPAHAWVEADWFLKTVLDNLIENAVLHATDAPELSVSVECVNGEVVIRFVDDCPHIPDNERAMFTDELETDLDHSTGVGLWLVRLVMESYEGTVSHEHVPEGGNAIELRLRTMQPA